MRGYHECTELIPGANTYVVLAKEGEPEGIESFVDLSTYHYCLVDGKMVFKGVTLGKGWENHRFDPSHQRRDIAVPKKEIEWEAIIERVRQVINEQGLTIYKASGEVAKETGLHITTVYHKVNPILSQEANHEKPLNEKDYNERGPGPVPAATATTDPCYSAPPLTDSITEEKKILKLRWIEDVLDTEKMLPGEKLELIAKLATFAG